MSFYRTGTIALTNGSAAVTGTGTNFLTGTAIGECLQAPDGKLYEILTINSATSITLGQNYLGSTASGQTYSIVPTQSYIRDLAGQAATLVNSFQTTKDNAVLVTAADKTTPVDTDKLALKDVTTGFGKWLTLANLKATLLTWLQGTVFPSPGVIGGTTPAAGAFTTLTGSTQINSPVFSGTTNGLTYFTDLSSANYIALQGSAADTPNIINFIAGGAGRAQISSSGLAVTGAINATGQISTPNILVAGGLNATVGGFYNSANKFGVDNNGGATRLYSSGPNSSTKGSFEFHATDSVGSLDTIAMVLDANGNFLVGDTSAGASERLKIKGSVNNNIVRIYNDNAAAYGLFLAYSQNINGSSNEFLDFRTNGTTAVFRVTSNGNVQNANNSYGAISDLKLKENITDATPKLNGLMQVRVVNYNLKTDPTHKQIGVIAQELETVFPGMIEETPDYIEVSKTREIPAVVDSEGAETSPAKTEEYTEREATGEVTKAVKYSVFIPILIKAIQEQQTLIAAMEARLTALESK